MKAGNLWESLDFAFQGIVHVLKTQRNMKIHFLIAFLVLIGSLFLNITRLELIILFIVITLVLIMELINTSIEIIIDMLAEEYNFRAKIAKNVSAGAVLLAALNAVVIGYFIFMNKIADLSLNVFAKIRQSPYYLTLINLGLLFILIITLKAFSKKGSLLQGGMPSGHSAIAFSVATIVIILGNNTLIASLGLLLALMVAQSRIQSETHTIGEVFIGAVLGVLLTVLVFQLL